MLLFSRELKGMFFPRPFLRNVYHWSIPTASVRMFNISDWCDAILMKRKMREENLKFSRKSIQILDSTHVQSIVENITFLCVLNCQNALWTISKWFFLFASFKRSDNNINYREWANLCAIIAATELWHQYKIRMFQLNGTFLPHSTTFLVWFSIHCIFKQHNLLLREATKFASYRFTIFCGTPLPTCLTSLHFLYSWK